MLLLTVTTLRNNDRIYTDEHIIHNFNSNKNKDFLLCAGRPRYHRLALLKYISDNNLLDNGFVSANLCPHTVDPITPFVNKYNRRYG